MKPRLRPNLATRHAQIARVNTSRLQLAIHGYNSANELGSQTAQVHLDRTPGQSAAPPWIGASRGPGGIRGSAALCPGVVVSPMSRHVLPCPAVSSHVQGACDSAKRTHRGNAAVAGSASQHCASAAILLNLALCHSERSGESRPSVMPALVKSPEMPRFARHDREVSMNHTFASCTSCSADRLRARGRRIPIVVGQPTAFPGVPQRSGMFHSVPAWTSVRNEPTERKG
jgi:hypothetical protein